MSDDEERTETDKGWSRGRFKMGMERGYRVDGRTEGRTRKKGGDTELY
jgi:hypothetical protein